VNLTNPQRARLLGRRLLTRPADIPRYVWWSLINLGFLKQLPIDLELPWISWAAIDFLKDFVGEKMHVFEYGAGGSTLFFARRCHRVVSVEDDQKWFKTTGDRLALNGVTNVELRFRPITSRQPEDFAGSSYVNAIGEERYDVILIDVGENLDEIERPACFKRAEQNVAPGGIIVFDDSWYPPYAPLRTSSRAKRVRVFESTGPCRIGVTSTDVYFY